MWETSRRDIPLVVPQPVRLGSLCMVMSGFEVLLIWWHQL